MAADGMSASATAATATRAVRRIFMWMSPRTGRVTGVSRCNYGQPYRLVLTGGSDHCVAPLAGGRCGANAHVTALFFSGDDVQLEGSTFARLEGKCPAPDAQVVVDLGMQALRVRIHPHRIDS